MGGVGEPHKLQRRGGASGSIMAREIVEPGEDQYVRYVGTYHATGCVVRPCRFQTL